MIKLSAPNITEEEACAAKHALWDGNLDPGPVAEDFACALADFWGVPRSWVLLTNSCTTAIGLTARDMTKKEKSWLAPAFTWPGTYCAVPCHILIDVDDELMANRANYRGNRAAVNMISVNIYGRFNGLDWDADIVDSAHCLNLSGMKEYVGEGGAVCFSFGPTKEITTIRGGAIVYKNADHLEDRIRCNTYKRVPQMGGGINGTITEVGATIGYKRLRRYTDDSNTRKEILDEYSKITCGHLHVSLITQPEYHSGHLAVLLFESPSARSRAADIFAKAGIQTSIHYLAPAGVIGIPKTIAASRRVLSIPCHTLLSPFQVKKVCDSLRRVIYYTNPLRRPQFAGLRIGGTLDKE